MNQKELDDYLADLARLPAVRASVARRDWERYSNSREGWAPNPSELWELERSLHLRRAAAHEALTAAGRPLPAEPPGLDGPTPPERLSTKFGRDARLPTIARSSGADVAMKNARVHPVHVTAAVFRDDRGALVITLVGDRRRADPPLVAAAIRRPVVLLGPEDASLATGSEPGELRVFGGEELWPVIVDDALEANTIAVPYGQPGRVGWLQLDALVECGAVTRADVAVHDETVRAPAARAWNRAGLQTTKHPAVTGFWQPRVHLSEPLSRLERKRGGVPIPNVVYINAPATASTEQLARWSTIVNDYTRDAEERSGSVTRTSLRDEYRAYLDVADLLGFVPVLPVPGLGDDASEWSRQNPS